MILVLHVWVTVTSALTKTTATLVKTILCILTTTTSASRALKFRQVAPIVTIRKLALIVTKRIIMTRPLSATSANANPHSTKPKMAHVLNALSTSSVSCVQALRNAKPAMTKSST